MSEIQNSSGRTPRLGPILGAVTDQTAKVWVCPNDSGPLWVHVWRRENGVPVRGSPFRPRQISMECNVQVFDLRLPDAETEYEWDLRGASERSCVPKGVQPLGFRTATRDSRDASFRFAFGSCNEARHTGFGLWRKMLRQFQKQRPELFLAIGDQVYADDCYARAIRQSHPTPAHLRELFRHAYFTHWTQAEVQALYARVPTYMIWDDHEIRDGWGSDVRDVLPARRRVFQAAREVYHEFQHSHNPHTFGERKRHYGLRRGKTGFLVLDGRGYRNIGRKTQPVLGREQWQDLRSWLTTHTPTLRNLFVVSSVPVIHSPESLTNLVGKSDLKDQWSRRENQPEQSRLLQTLFDVANEFNIQVVLLGGDIHVATVAVVRSRDPRHQRRPVIYQFTSSPLNNDSTSLWHKVMSGLEGAMEIDPKFEARILRVWGRRNYAVVDVDYDSVEDQYQIKLELHRENVRHPEIFPLGFA